MDQSKLNVEELDIESEINSFEENYLKELNDQIVNLSPDFLKLRNIQILDSSNKRNNDSGVNSSIYNNSNDLHLILHAKNGVKIKT